MCRDPINQAVHEYGDIGPLHLVAERLGAQRSLRSHVAEWKVVPGRLRGRSQVSQSHLRPAGRFKRSCVVPIRTGETDT